MKPLNDNAHPLESLLQQHCPNGVEFRELGELCEINGGKLNANKAQAKGLYEFFTYDYNNPKFVDNYAWDTEALIICKKDNGENPCRYFNGKFNAFQWMRILHSFKNEANIHYIKYYFNAIFMQFLQTNSINISLPYIAIETIKKFQIPLPPLEIQQKIVEILDAFTELQAELQAELHARRKQYEYYRNKLLSFEELQRRTDMLNGGGLKLVSLGEVCEVKRGVRVTKKDLTENEKYPVFQNSLTPMGYYNQSNVNANTPFIIVGGSAGEIGWSSSSCWAADDCIYFICEKSLMNRFLYHALCNQQHYFLSQVRKASIPRLSQDCIKNLKIPLPPLEVQNDIVELLDKFDTLANDLTSGIPAEIEARKKQYEYYRERLLSFIAKD
ncbi:restriction endonuclease subunit S [Campylobacter upsaliensis]|nr:restriction endonuclease subunit S [Campylobacter upsaliensis]